MARFCSLFSSSSGNCTYIGTSSANILVDVGVSAKRAENALREKGIDPGSIDAIFVTHEHSDHIKGLGVLARRYGIPIYATGGTFAGIDKCTSVGKVPNELRHVIKADVPFSVGDVFISPFAISHDAAEPVGFRIEHEGKKCAVATDMGCWDDYIREKLKDLDVLLLESNHDVRMLEAGRYPYYLKRRILSDHGSIRHIFLGHLSKENNYEALAFETVSTEVTLGDNPWNSKDFNITIAHRDLPSEQVEW